MLHSEAMDLIAIDPRSGQAEHDRRHRDHRASDLLAVQAHPGDARGPPGHRCQRSGAGLCARGRVRPAAADPDPPGGRRRRPVRPRRHLPAGAASRARAHRSGRLVRLDPVAGRVACRGPRLDRGRPRGSRAVGRGTGRAHRPPARDRPRGGRRDRRDDPWRRVGRPAGHDLHAEVAAPRRRGDHPRRPDRGGRSAPAAGRDLDPHRAVRHAPPGRPRHHRADRRGGRRRLRGERPDQSRRTGPHRPEPDRDRPRPGDPGVCSTRPAAAAARSAGGRPARRAGSTGRSPRLRELGRFVGRSPGSGTAAGDRRPRRAPSRSASRSVDGRTGAARPGREGTAGDHDAAPSRPVERAPASAHCQRNGRPAGSQPKPPASASSEADAVAPAAARAPR